MVLKPSIRISKIRARIPGFDVTAPGFDVTAHGYGYWLMDTGTGMEHGPGAGIPGTPWPAGTP